MDLPREGAEFATAATAAIAGAALKMLRRLGSEKPKGHFASDIGFSLQ